LNLRTATASYPTIRISVLCWQEINKFKAVLRRMKYRKTPALAVADGGFTVLKT